MPEHKTPVETKTPWYGKMALVVLLPFILPTLFLVVAILLAIGFCAVILNLVSEISFVAHLWRRGRFLHWRKLKSRIAEDGPGTLIIETPSLGWRFTHAWWTPENVQFICPYSIPTSEDYRLAGKTRQCTDWDRWLWSNYTDPDKGRGYLLRVWNGWSMEKNMRQTFPLVKVVHTWTALIDDPLTAAE